MAQLDALIFDVFGTVVDWRSGVAREAEAATRHLGVTGVDWGHFADRWRARYGPSMAAVREGQRPFVPLDVLHRENLDGVLEEFAISGLTEDEKDGLNRAWHRLDPWPDSVTGLMRLRSKFIIAPHSNGHLALMVNMARRAGLPWDAILGAEVVGGHYKPAPESYRGAVRMLDLPPERVMLVAAHNGDLVAAREACGMRTAFISRPLEYGEAREAVPTATYDYAALDLEDLATQLGC
jgi:2-haloacid dehalogenase